ncbi:FmdB family transcriptional regulator [Arthrobacter agilis]|uniref:FmdB family transcriptional regulator n=1 Tax=Arthrobacter agilis TaxID=37921 RepID=A0A2L0UEF8_9MICC|nr:FmdB family zinc ribbon protein [Arthrobacter agilis]AUZ87640.1 FmdB family transcriptional regulator [Arthrobacter agilis]
MPMYAYACKDCGHAFDIQQSFSDDSLTVCPECGGSLRKKFNSVGVVFKGSGFYRNDSRDTKTSTDAGSSSASSAAKPTSDASSSTASSSSSTASPSTAGATSSGAAAAAS